MSRNWYYSENIGFLHTEHCTTCQKYVTHLSQSDHKPLEWAVLMEQCERLRAERNYAHSLSMQLKKDNDALNHELLSTKEILQLLQDESPRVQTDLLKSSTIYVDPQTPAEDARPENRSATPSGGTRRVQRGPRNISQLQSLMTAAHEPGNTRALSKVKALCAEAHATPRENKTPLQQYLLIHWRNPETPNDVGGPNQPRAKTNPRRDDPIDVWYDYLCTHQASWPRGVRRDAYDRPFLPDLKASRVVAQLRPADASPITAGSGAATVRFEFLAVLTDLLDQRGMYRTLLANYGISVSPIINPKPYTAPFPISTESVVRHLAECGVNVQSVQDELEPWAHNYRLIKDNE